MKRIVLLLIAFVVCLALSAQTYCYQQTQRVEKDTGVKTKGSDKYCYITFINNKACCYFSDKDGTTTEEPAGYTSMFGVSTGQRYEGKNYYRYQGKENGLYAYKAETTYYSMIPANYYMGERGGYYPMYTKRSYLYFNSSFDRINAWDDPKTYVVSNSSSDSQLVRAARAGFAMGTSYGTTSNTYIYVYEKRSAPSDSSDNPTVFY